MTENYSKGLSIKKGKVPRKPEDAPIGTGYAKGAKDKIIDRKKKLEDQLSKI